MKKINANFQKAIMALDPNYSRNDHYDGVNAIYRLAAYVPVPEGCSPDGIRRQIKKLIKELNKLEVRPNRLNIYEDMIEIDYYPKGYQMVMNRGQYAGLQLEFAEFRNKAPILDLFFQDGFFRDDQRIQLEVSAMIRSISFPNLIHLVSAQKIMSLLK
ncbi:hypothetical protein P4472_13595 [Bacillus subtilis]|nr:hypothetical protein [Bacillus subtilis]MED3693410.1 hypothetical protein [Bacillus subtilis]